MTYQNGLYMYELTKKLFPICRSITGDGLRETLKIISGELDNQLKTYEIPTGTKCFDWTIPNEWTIRDAYIKNSSGERIVDFKKNNLHIINYSMPFKGTLSLEELNKNLHSLPDKPNAIPYMTSYYKERWGFCLTDQARKSLKEDQYEVYIDSDLKPGSITLADMLIPGKVKKEVLISTYVCHPSMANNELSGPVLATKLAQYLMSKDNHYSYRIVIVPETIGAIAYLSKNLDTLKKLTVAGLQLTCVGDDKEYSFMPSRNGATLADKVSRFVLDQDIVNYKSYTFLDRGSDERQYCSPGVNLPIVSMPRSKYGTYKEYHTSLDDLSFVSEKGLEESFQLHKKFIEVLETNKKYKATNYCEPQLSKHGLRDTMGGNPLSKNLAQVSNILAYSDGEHDLIDLSKLLATKYEDVLATVQILEKNGLLKIYEEN